MKYSESARVYLQRFKDERPGKFLPWIFSGTPTAQAPGQNFLKPNF